MGLSMIDAVTNQLRLPDVRSRCTDSCIIPYTLPPDLLRHIRADPEHHIAFIRALCYALRNLGCRSSLPALIHPEMLTKAEYETICVMLPHLSPILYSITDILDVTWCKLHDIRCLGPDIYLYFN